MKCSLCEFSEPADDSRHTDGNRLSCNCPKFISGYGVNVDKLKDDEVHVEDDEGWAFVVGPDFGCIHYSKR